MRTIAVMLAVVVVGACSAAPTAAQFIDDQAKSQSRLENPHKVRVQIGMTFHAAGSPMLGIYGTTPIPRDWDEQKVRIVGEDRSPEVRVSYRTLGDTTRQMVITVSRVPPQSEAHALITFEVTRYAIAPPNKTDEYHIPEHVEGMLRQYLGPSPAIESRHAKIRELAKKIFAEKENATDWQKIEALDDYVLAHLKYRAGSLKGALAGLNDGNGDCEEFSSLFIALCRANGVPARTVWIPDHCYSEFYLLDKNGKGIWFPCQSAGAKSFGGIADYRPIWQKGDNFHVPDFPKPQRYVAEFLKIKVPGGQRPQFEFVRKVLAD